MHCHALFKGKPFRCQCDHAHRWVHLQPQWLVTATNLERMLRFVRGYSKFCWYTPRRGMTVTLQTAVARLAPPVVSISSLYSDPPFFRRRNNRRHSTSRLVLLPPMYNLLDPSSRVLIVVSKDAQTSSRHLVLQSFVRCYVTRLVLSVTEGNGRRNEVSPEAQ